MRELEKCQSVKLQRYYMTAEKEKSSVFKKREDAWGRKYYIKECQPFFPAKVISLGRFSISFARRKCITLHQK